MRAAVRLLVLVAIAAALPLTSCRRAEEREQEADLPVPVIAEPVRQGSINRVIGGTGVVEALTSARVDIRSERPARIAEITKQVGDAVISGEPLVRFEFPALRAQMAAGTATLKAAETRVNAARLQRDRVGSLLSRGAASRSEMDEAIRQFEAAEADATAAAAAVHLAEAQAQSALVNAPFNGVVLERFHHPGDFVQPDAQNPILRLIDPRQVQVQAVVSPADAVRFTVGATARAIAEQQATSGLLRVATRPTPEAGATSVPITLTFEVPTELPLGTQVALEIEGEQRLNVPLVPAIAILKDEDERRYVMIASGAIAQRRAVTAGLSSGEQIEVLSGVKPGELVITQGHTTLRDGAAITITPP